MKKILTCVGTRPNFIKVMKLKRLLKGHGFDYRLLHTGQHFDRNMSEIFFEQLKLGKPDYYLGVGGSSNNESVGTVITKMEEVLNEYRPDLVIVPGDVNSTFACCYAAASHDIPVAHIESGLRSFDRTMPEERNRILTDHLSELLFVTEPVGVSNLKKEGIAEEKIKLVGNTIVDALQEMTPFIDKSAVLEEIGAKEKYCLFTFHRPANVDLRESLIKIVEIIKQVSKNMQVIFPMHPRTRKRLEEGGLMNELVADTIVLTEPKGYIDFLKLIGQSKCVVTDSGGIQIESSYLNVPCFTVRETTELKITIEQGTNTLVPLEPAIVTELIFKSMKGDRKHSVVSPQWDGRASERIVVEIAAVLNGVLASVN